MRSGVTVADGVDSSSLSIDDLGSGAFIKWRLFLRRVLPDSVFTTYDRGVDLISVTTAGTQVSLPALNPLMASHGDHSRTSVFPKHSIASHVHPTPPLAKGA